MSARGAGAAAAQSPFADAAVAERCAPPDGDDKENDAGRAAPSNLPKADDTGVIAQLLDVDADAARVTAVAPGVGVRAFRFDALFDAGPQAAVRARRARGSSSTGPTARTRPSCCTARRARARRTPCSAPTRARRPTSRRRRPRPPPRRATRRARAGIVPRACAEAPFRRRARGPRASTHALSLAYVEVFGDDVTDLLAEGDGRRFQNAAAAQRWVLDGHAEHAVASVADAAELLRAARRASGGPRPR